MIGQDLGEFLSLEADELEVYARARASARDLGIPASYLPDVLLNLGVLQGHAAILAAALAAAGPESPGLAAP